MNRLSIRSAWVAVLLAGSIALAQQAGPEDDVGAPIKVDVSVVNVLFSVRDGKKRLVPNLEKSDFEVREDGKPQPIVYFARESKLPLTLGLLIDSSVSQRRLSSDE